MFSSIRLISRKFVNFSIKNFARISNKNFPKIIPDQGKHPPREVIIPEFSEVNRY